MVARREEGYELETVRCPCSHLARYGSCCCPKAQSFWLLQGCRTYLSSRRVIELGNSDLTIASREINRCRQFHTCLWSHGVVLLSCRAVQQGGEQCVPHLLSAAGTVEGMWILEQQCHCSHPHILHSVSSRSCYV